MSAKLVVTAGPLVDSELWLEYEVVRIGSGDDCELQLVDACVEPHAVTLRYADGRYLLYNRSSQTLRLESKLVEPNGSDTWRNGKTLQLPGGTSLRLETTGDGAPVPRRDDTPLPTLASGAEGLPIATAAPAGNALPTPPKKNDTGQVLLVALLFAAAIGVLLMNGPDTKPVGEKAKSFAQLSAELRKDDSLTPDLWVRFSEAYTAAYRGRADEAQQAYRRLRDRIDWERNLLLQAGKPLPQTLLDADAYVKQRLTGKR
jgi:hypothetical protein